MVPVLLLAVAFLAMAWRSPAFVASSAPLSHAASVRSAAFVRPEGTTEPGLWKTFGLSVAFAAAVLRRSKRESRESRVAMCADRRVVVTGMGITSCLGNTLDDVAESLKEGKSGITFSEEYEELGIKSKVRGRPDLTAAQMKELIPRKTLRFMGPNAQYAYIALDRAIQDAGLKPEDYEQNERCASILGQGGTSIPDVTESCGFVADQ
ncbi:unnamed protein product, partial [Effrenium voratum]